jgi:hypothetical protein
MPTKDKDIPLLLWPIHAIWHLLTFVLNVTGRIICGLLGIALMIAGVAVTLSVVAAPIGIPLAAFGFLLLVRALF